MVVICIWCSLFVMSQFDVMFVFPNQRFDEVCWHNMHNLLHALLLIYVSWYQGVLLKIEVWECSSHTKQKGRLIRLQEFPHWIFLFHFSATVLYTRKLVISSFMLLQALHVEIEMKNLDLKVTLLVRKCAGTPFPRVPTPLHSCMALNINYQLPRLGYRRK